MNVCCILLIILLVLILLCWVVMWVAFRSENPYKGKIRVYCAGPMGGPEDFKTMRDISNAIKAAGYDTYLPVDDGFSLLVMFNALDSSTLSEKEKSQIRYYMMIAVFALDIFNVLEYCQATIADVNKFETCTDNPDSGTVVEVTLSAAYNKPLALYKSEDQRYFPIGSNKTNGWDNPMMVGLVNDFNLMPDYGATNTDELIKKLKEAIDKKPMPLPQRLMPQNIQNYIKLGKIVHDTKANYDEYKGDKLTNEIAVKMMQDVVGKVKANASKYGVADWNGHIQPPVKANGNGNGNGAPAHALHMGPFL